MEVLTAARALDLCAPLTPAAATDAVRAGLRQDVTGPARYLAPEIAAAVTYVSIGRALAAAETVTGKLR